MPFIQYDHKPLFFTLRRSERAKRLQLVARGATFEVVAPWCIGNRAIIQFVSQHRQWMSRQAKRHLKRAPSPETIWPNVFLAGETVPFRGGQLNLIVRFGAIHATLQQQKCLIVTVAWQTPCAQLESAIKKQLLAWYQQQAMHLIEASLARFCPILGRWPKGVQLKQQKSRWGSCGVTGRIYLNWLLVLAPPGILEYVVVHELGHLFHRHHGPRFWAKVAQVMADFAEQDKWLNGHGQRLKLPPHW